MNKGIPRRNLEELITRWTLARLPLIVVEGVSDQRFFSLIQGKDFCEDALKNLDVWPVEYIEVPASLVEKHGFVGTGAKQRVVSLGREIEAQGYDDGFRAIVDKDLDPFLKINFQSKGVFYTDPCCMDAYSWSIDSLSYLVDFYKCERIIRNFEKRNALYESLNEACVRLSAVRLVVIKHPEFQANLHYSEKSLSLVNGVLVLDLDKYVEQCAPKKGLLAEFKAVVEEELRAVLSSESIDLINGHDLIWLLTFSLREITDLPRRAIDSELVSSSLTAAGVLNNQLLTKPLFRVLSGWASRF